MLPEAATAAKPSTATPSSQAPVRASTTDDASFDQLLAALRAAHGNVSRAAAAIGISRARAYRLLDAHPGFDVRQIRDESNGSE
jgi:transcriptional regulator of acetoin/glycerol metabolism